MNETVTWLDQATNKVVQRTGLDYVSTRERLSRLREKKSSMKDKDFLAWLEELSVEALWKNMIDALMR